MFRWKISYLFLNFFFYTCNFCHILFWSYFIKRYLFYYVRFNCFIIIVIVLCTWFKQYYSGTRLKCHTNYLRSKLNLSIHGFNKICHHEWQFLNNYTRLLNILLILTEMKSCAKQIGVPTAFLKDIIWKIQN